MRNLVAAGFERYKRNKWFWVLLISALLLGLMEGGVNFKSEDWGLGAVNVLFFEIVILVSLHIGQGYSDGAIRNQLVMGYTKGQLLFSDMILHSCVILGVVLLYWIPYFVFFYPELFEMRISLVILFVSVIILLCITVAIQLVTVSYLISSKAGGVVVNFFQIFVLSNLLSELHSVISIEEFDILYRGDPLSQMNLFTYYFVCKHWYVDEVEWQLLDVGLSVRYPLISVIRCLAFGIVGWFFFRRKNIK